MQLQSKSVEEKDTHSEIEQLKVQMGQVLSMLKRKYHPEDHTSAFASSCNAQCSGSGMNTSFCSYDRFIASVQTMNAWVIDSGATDHICISFQLMHSVVELSKPIVLSLPNGSHATVTHTGSVNLTPTLVLHDVLYVSTFKFNLLSIPKLLAQTSYTVKFTRFHCYFQDHLKKITIVGDLHEGLFLLQGPAFKSSKSTNLIGQVAPRNSSSELWHKRLSHTTLNTLWKIP